MDPGTKLQMNGHKELITLAVVSVLVAVLKIELCFVQEEGYIFHMSIVVEDWLIDSVSECVCKKGRGREKKVHLR